MTAQQRESIAELRAKNFPYSFIGKALNLSPNTVKSICRRNGYVAHGERKTKAEKQSVVLCKNCRKPFPEGTRTDAVFCSDYCRTVWRRNNRKIIEK